MRRINNVENNDWKEPRQEKVKIEIEKVKKLLTQQGTSLK